MGLLYRTPIFITRQQPFIDWANGADEEGPALTLDLSERRMVYLVASPEGDTELAALLDDSWVDIFEEELFSWIVDESTWPAGRTREMFDAWFASEVGDAVVDLDPEEPLTEDDVDREELVVALNTCAWCDAELDAERARTVGFALPDCSLLSHREGRVWAVGVGKRRFVTGIVSPVDSDIAADGADVIYRACSRRCERLLNKLMPKAIRDASRLLSARQPPESGGSEERET
jgi:hypothetical protein